MIKRFFLGLVFFFTVSVLISGCGNPPVNGSPNGSAAAPSATTTTSPAPATKASGADPAKAFADFQKALKDFRSQEVIYGMAVALGNDNSLNESLYRGYYANLVAKQLALSIAINKSETAPPELKSANNRLCLSYSGYVLLTQPGASKKNLNSVSSGLAYTGLKKCAEEMAPLINSGNALSVDSPVPNELAAAEKTMLDANRDYQNAIQGKAAPTQIKAKAEAYQKARTRFDDLKKKQ